MEHTTCDSQSGLNRLIYAGGIQRYFPRYEAQIYRSQFSLDVTNYCLKEFSSGDLTENEIGCVERLSKKNAEFLNL